jgi:hypothetical protein
MAAAVLRERDSLQRVQGLPIGPIEVVIRPREALPWLANHSAPSGPGALPAG